MRRFFRELAALAHSPYPDLFEKDYYVHGILRALSDRSDVRDLVAFKGGTCLVKTFRGYYRFSEDIDLAWSPQREWEGSSPSAIRRECNRRIDEVLDVLCTIADELGLVLSKDKGDGRYVHISSGGRLVTYRLYYDPQTLSHLSTRLGPHIKIQLNFVDTIAYPIRNQRIRPFMEGFEDEPIWKLFPEWSARYGEDVSFPCYDLREIYVEKHRAALTRRSMKFRDVVDIAKIERDRGYDPTDFEEIIEEKIRFAIDQYERYADNIRAFDGALPVNIPAQEERLMLDRSALPSSSEIETIMDRLRRMRLRICDV